MRLFLTLTLLTVPALAGPLGAQALSLRDALELAEAHAFANRRAAGETDAQEAAVSSTLRGVLPTFRLEGGYLGTNDPLGAFGTLLRQRAVTVEAFEPSRLNFPETIGNVGVAAVVEQPLFNADALHGRRAALHAAAASRASEEWTRSATRISVISAYYGALLAQEMVTSLDTALLSAQAHQRQAESLHRNGVVTRSDALLAAVRSGEVEARLVAARGESALAGARLAVAVGIGGDSVRTRATHLPAAPAIRVVASAPLPADLGRPDVQAAQSAQAAASADVRRASGLLLPRVNAFGRIDWNTPQAPFGGESSWTAGIMLSWSPFSGGSELAEGRAARARRASAAVVAEAAEAQAKLEVRSAETRAAVALVRMELAERAVGQSVEAHRIVARKYEGGAASVTELFDAAATETGARLAFAQSRYEAILAAAERLRARGGDAAAIVTLEDVEQ